MTKTFIVAELIASLVLPTSAIALEQSVSCPPLPKSAQLCEQIHWESIATKDRAVCRLACAALLTPKDDEKKPPNLNDNAPVAGPFPIHIIPNASPSPAADLPHSQTIGYGQGSLSLPLNPKDFGDLAKGRTQLVCTRNQNKPTKEPTKVETVETLLECRLVPASEGPPAFDRGDHH